MAISERLFEIKKVTELTSKLPILGAYFAHCESNGVLYKATMDELATFLAPYVTAVGASGFVAVESNALPVAEAGKFTIVGADTYTQSGGDNIDALDLLNILSHNGTEWVLTTGIGIPAYTYATTVEANTAIPNEVFAGKNKREGKTVLIGQPGGYVRYMWIGGFMDANLAKADPVSKELLSRNVFDVSNLDTGLYIEYVTGSGRTIGDRIPIEGFSATRYAEPIKCKPNTLYTTNIPDYAIIFKDKNFAIISGIQKPNNNGQFTTPANCEYFETYVKDDKKDFITIVEGSLTMMDRSVYGDKRLGVVAENVVGVDLPGIEKLVDNNDLFEASKIRRTSVTAGTYADYLTGKVISIDDTAQDKYYTFKARIKAGKTYEFGDIYRQQFAFFTKAGVYISGYAATLNGESKRFTAPLNAYYIVFTGTLAGIANQYLIELSGVVELHNPANKTNGKYVDYATGNLLDNAATSVTTVSVKPNTTYEFGSTVQQQLVWKRKDGTVISGYAGSISGYENQLTSPNGAFIAVYTTNIADDVSQSFRKVELQDVVKTIKITAVKNANNWNSVRNTATAIKDSSKNKRYIITVPFGVWNEIDLGGYGDFIKIVGQDRYRTFIDTLGASTNVNYIIPSDYMGTGEYAGQQIASVPLIWKHTVFLRKNLLISNVTLRASNCKYALHADDNRYAKFIGDNISLEETANCNNVIGMGIWGGQNFELTNFSVKRSTPGQAGIFFHNWNNQLAGTRTNFKNGRFINCYYADVSELGSDQEDTLIFENCSSDTENKIKYFVTMENGATMYNKVGGGKEVNPLLVPYSIHTVIAGTNVDNYDISSGQRPNALTYVQQSAVNASKSDLQYRGTFDSLALAIAGVPLATRKLGDTVVIKENGSVVEYWWKTLTTDAGLIKKTADLKEWEAKVYAKDERVKYLGKYWTSNAATVAGDIPGTSTKWSEDLTAYKPNELTRTATPNLIDYSNIVRGSILSSIGDKTPITPPSVSEMLRQLFPAGTYTLLGYYNKSGLSYYRVEKLDGTKLKGGQVASLPKDLEGNPLLEITEEAYLYLNLTWGANLYDKNAIGIFTGDRTQFYPPLPVTTINGALVVQFLPFIAGSVYEVGKNVAYGNVLYTCIKRTTGAELPTDKACFKLYVGAELGFKLSAKNLFDPEKMILTGVYLNGLGDIYTISGEISASVVKIRLNLIEGEITSYYSINQRLNSNGAYRLEKLDGTKIAGASAGTLPTSLSGEGKTFAITEDVYFYQQLYFKNGTTLSNNVDISTYQIEAGQYKTTFEPYKQIVSINGVGFGVQAKTALSQYEDKTVVTAGDSITEGTMGGYVKFIKEVLGCFIRNLGSSGSRIGRMIALLTDIKDRSDTVVTAAAPDYTTVSAVTIQIGTNGYLTGSVADFQQADSVLNHVGTELDYFNAFPNTFYGNFGLVIEWILWKNPKCRIYIITIPNNSNPNIDQEAFAVALKTISEYYATGFVDALHNSGMPLKLLTKYTYDSTHFNELGNEVWGKYIGNFMKGN